MDTRSESGESLSRYGKSFGIAVKPDQFKAGESFQESFGMTGHSEGGVNEHRATPLECGSQQLDGSLKHYRGVDFAVNHGSRTGPFRLIPIRSDLTPGKWRQG